MVSDINNGLIFLFAIENVTLILTVIPLAIFIWIFTITKRIKSFQFQILIFIILYFIGELIENLQTKNAIFSSTPSDIGPQIHVIAALYFTIIIIIRFFCSTQKGKKINDESK